MEDVAIDTTKAATTMEDRRVGILHAVTITMHEMTATDEAGTLMTAVGIVAEGRDLQAATDVTRWKPIAGVVRVHMGDRASRVTSTCLSGMVLMFQMSRSFFNQTLTETFQIGSRCNSGARD